MPTARALLFQKRKYLELIRLALPMILSSSGLVLMQFIDGVFLCQHATVDMGAAGTASCTAWMVCGIVCGMVGFTSAITANMIGAKLESHVGPAVWQGIYVSCAAGALTFAMSFFSRGFYRLCGHVEELAWRESVYLQITLACGIFLFMQNALTGFFSGRGDNTRLMLTQLAGQLVNVVGDYVLIFGKFGAPEMGIAGAAIATVLGTVVTLVLQFWLFLQPRHRRRYHTGDAGHVDFMLLRQIVVLGGPSGLQHCVDAGFWVVFLVLVGRLGIVEVTATNLAFRLNSLALLPVLGIGRASTTFIGQAHGRKEPETVLEYTGHSAALCQLWMVTVAISYFLFPRQYMGIFLDDGVAANGGLVELGTVLLRFVALYCLADAFNVAFCCALQAVGDTHFLFKFMSVATAVVAAAVLCIDYLGGDIRALWICATAYVMALPPFYFLRLKGGRWRNIQVAR